MCRALSSVVQLSGQDVTLDRAKTGDSPRRGGTGRAPLFGQFTAPIRLYLPNATWCETVSTLIPVADQVVVWAAEPLTKDHPALAASRTWSTRRSRRAAESPSAPPG